MGPFFIRAQILRVPERGSCSHCQHQKSETPWHTGAISMVFWCRLIWRERQSRDEWNKQSSERERGRMFHLRARIQDDLVFWAFAAGLYCSNWSRKTRRNHVLFTRESSAGGRSERIPTPHLPPVYLPLLFYWAESNSRLTAISNEIWFLAHFYETHVCVRFILIPFWCRTTTPHIKKCVLYHK